jgi:hypothetical protein
MALETQIRAVKIALTTALATAPETSAPRA